MLELIQGGEAPLALAREAWEYGRGLVDQQGLDDLARRKLAYPLTRVRLLAPIPAPGRNVFCLGRNYADHAAERGAAYGAPCPGRPATRSATGPSPCRVKRAAQPREGAGCRRAVSVCRSGSNGATLHT